MMCLYVFPAQRNTLSQGGQPNALESGNLRKIQDAAGGSV